MRGSCRPLHSSWITAIGIGPTRSLIPFLTTRSGRAGRLEEESDHHESGDRVGNKYVDTRGREFPRREWEQSSICFPGTEPTEQLAGLTDVDPCAIAARFTSWNVFGNRVQRCWTA